MDQARRAVDLLEEVARQSCTVRGPEFAGRRVAQDWPRAASAELLAGAVLHNEHDGHGYVGVYVLENEASVVDHNRPLPPVTIGGLNGQMCFGDRGRVNPS